MTYPGNGEGDQDQVLKVQIRSTKSQSWLKNQLYPPQEVPVTAGSSRPPVPVMAVSSRPPLIFAPARSCRGSPTLFSRGRGRRGSGRQAPRRRGSGRLELSRQGGRLVGVPLPLAPPRLGGLKGSATKGRFRKCGLTVVLPKYDPKETGRGCATRLWNPKNTFFKLTLYHGPLISRRHASAIAAPSAS